MPEKSYKNTTLEDLAQMTARGFTDMQERMATKDDLKNFATKDDLKNFATKDDLKNFTTKDDLKELRDNIDFMLGRHMGLFRKDFEEILARVKKLEEAVFK